MVTPPNPESQPHDIRVYFAAQRTMLAWIRTGVAFMGFGFIVARFGLFLREMAALRSLPETPQIGVSMWIGTALLFVGVGVNVVAAARFASFASNYRRAKPLRPPTAAVELILAAILAIVGIVLAVYLFKAR